MPGRVSSKDFPRSSVPAGSLKAWQTMDGEGMVTPDAPFTERSNPGETAMMTLVADC